MSQGRGDSQLMRNHHAPHHLRNICAQELFGREVEIISDDPGLWHSANTGDKLSYTTLLVGPVMPSSLLRYKETTVRSYRFCLTPAATKPAPSRWYWCFLTFSLVGWKMATPPRFVRVEMDFVAGWPTMSHPSERQVSPVQSWAGVAGVPGLRATLEPQSLLCGHQCEATTLFGNGGSTPAPRAKTKEDRANTMAYWSHNCPLHSPRSVLAATVPGLVPTRSASPSVVKVSLPIPCRVHLLAPAPSGLSFAVPGRGPN